MISIKKVYSKNTQSTQIPEKGMKVSDKGDELFLWDT